MNQTWAVILAAGRSTRMVAAKQLLELDGEYLLESVIRLVLSADFSRVIAVIGHEAERIEQTIAIRDARFQWVFNPAYPLGQSTSFRLGMEAAMESRAAAVMMFLGDQPFIRRQSVGEVKRAGEELLSRQAEPFVLQPVFEEKPGHPVFFGNPESLLLDAVSGDQGAKPIMASIKHRVFLPIDDPGIHVDLDTQEDVEKARQVWGRRE